MSEVHARSVQAPLTDPRQVRRGDCLAALSMVAVVAPGFGAVLQPAEEMYGDWRNHYRSGQTRRDHRQYSGGCQRHTRLSHQSSVDSCSVRIYGDIAIATGLNNWTEASYRKTVSVYNNVSAPRRPVANRCGVPRSHTRSCRVVLILRHCHRSVDFSYCSRSSD
jgi:hypothetical protein